MDANTIEYKVRDLSTKSVILFPTRAQVVRELKDIPLKPGTNEIIVVGLTPTVDEESIKVEGSGSAIITDIAVELLPNRDIFEEIYPDEDAEDSDDNSDAEESDDELIDPPALKAVRDKLIGFRDNLARAREQMASGESRLQILDAYGKMLDRKRNVNIDDGLETYRSEREKVFSDRMQGLALERQLEQDIREAAKEEDRLVRAQNVERVKQIKAKAKIARAKAKEKAKEARRRAERRKEKLRIRKERESFWPKLCYTVRITLDATPFTPGSSRRASISSEADVHVVSEKVPEKAVDDAEGWAAAGTCDLLLSYVTSSAFWSPHYDLQLSTMTNTATLCFDARLTNTTSETWTNAKITLSTSQTTFAGLEDALPTLVPWRIKLASKYSGIIENDVMDSREERDARVGWQMQQRRQVIAQKPRSQLFGMDNAAMHPTFNVYDTLAGPDVRSNQIPALAPYSNSFGAQAPLPPPPLPAPVMAIRASAPPGSALLGSSLAKRKSSPPMRDRKRSGGGGQASGSAAFAEFYEGGDSDEMEAETMLEAQPELDFQESSVEETGLTTTYDLPGLKTLVPKTTASKQRVARVSFSNVIFSHTVVAKYKPVAYLKAKLRNSSKLTLLKGATGLTLDGSFLGRTQLPRCSAGDSFFLSLGIDPAIKVTYPKPEVRRATTGVFSKEDSSVYTRTITIANTKATAGKPVTIIVFDQAPVSEDERLRVEILAPRGLSLNSGGVNTGIPSREGKEDKDWGKATATLKKAGEVTWEVSLKAGRGVKLGLEYQVAAPSGELVVQC